MKSGLRIVQIEDHDRAITFACIVQYPTLAAASGTTLGPYTFDATLDAPIASGLFPVCLISHGGGGSHLLYRSIGTHLSRRGFIVVSPEHPGDNKNDRSLSNTDESAVARPRHMSLALDALLADPFFRLSADACRVGIVGHSMGGFTALALAGGHAWSRSGQALPVIADSRIGAAVLLAPATDWFMAPGALDSVVTPLLVMAGERDPVTPPDAIQRALARLPAGTPLEMIVVPGAGHFSFLSPFPVAMQRADFPPASDPEGFDREQFHEVLPVLVHDFLVRTLGVRFDE